MMSVRAKKILTGVAICLGVILAVIITYVLYVLISYKRIPDRQALDVVKGADKDAVATGKTYTIVTQNLGFGAYTADFTFFMDGGKQSRAESRDSVISCIEKGGDTVAGFDPDFILFQEVDTDSTRSFHVNEKDILLERFKGYDSVFAFNYNSAYLMYPLIKPHGASNSGMLTLGKYSIDSSVRRSLPISTGFSKFVDLDRCYTVSRVPVENGKEFVIYNVHLSAYGNNDEIRKAQMTMLFDDIKAEYEAGNYCVCGGDFNHDFTGDSTKLLNGGESVGYGWAQPFPHELLPNCIKRCDDYVNGTLPTCRNCDVPYVKGETFVIIVDGFLVTSNVTAVSVENIQTGFEYSDHSPVVLKFSLEP